MPPPVTYKGTFPADHSELSAGQLHAPFHYAQTTDPGAVGAGKWWFNTSTNILYVRNGADSGWTAVTVEAHTHTHDHDSDYVELTGDTMTGNLIVEGRVTSDELYVTETSTGAVVFRKQDLTNVLIVDTTNSDVELRNGASLIGWSGDATGETWRVESATGDISSDGNIALAGDADIDGNINIAGSSVIGGSSSELHLVAGRIGTTGSTPSISVNAVNTTGAGLGATGSLSGNNQSGTLVLDPAGTPGAGTLATITFASSVDRGGTSYGIWLTPDDADALTDHSKVRAIRSSGTQWLFIANAALNLNSHQWHYLVVES